MSKPMKFYVTEKIGKKRSKTPEGFLLCEDVPISRTGMMIYGPNETPIEAGPEGLVKIFREDKDVFSPETIASFQGKDVTMQHPEEDVKPENWKVLTVGVCLNPRRGEGMYDDLLLADLLIKDPEAIKLVEEELPEVSCGYSADYEETGPGVGYQRNILGNHIALVENGRCGPRCAIGDHSTVVQPKKEKEAMAKETLLQRALKAFHAKDEAALAEVIAEKEKTGDETISGGEPNEGGATHIHIHAGGSTASATEKDEEPTPVMAGGTGEGGPKVFDDETEARFAALEKGHEEIKGMLQQLLGGNQDEGAEVDPEQLEAQLKDEAPEGLEEEASKAKDSAYLVDSFRTTVAEAEILAPGLQVPTFDRAAAPGSSFKAICGLRRQALDKAYADQVTKGLINDILGGKTLDTKGMTCDAVRTLFKAAVSVKQRSNNLSIMGNRSGARDTGATGPARITTLAQLNEANAKRFGQKQ